MSVFRDAGDNKQYTDEYKLFKKDTEVRDKLMHEAEPDGKFKACDEVDYYEQEEIINGTTSIIKRYLTIKTPARKDIHPLDKLYSVKDGQVWNVGKATIADDNNCKQKSLRPKKVTYIELWGVVK